MKPIDASQARLEEASQWWLRLREDSVRPDEIGQWLDWCQRDPANLQVFEKIETLGARMEALDGETRVMLMRELLDEGDSGPLPPAMPPPASAPRYRLLRPALLSSLLIVVCAGLIAWWSLGTHPAGLQNELYATARAERDQVRLTDGSQLALGAATAVKVDYNPQWRNLELDHGEAYFEVEHDRQRPFVVHVGRLKVIAVGTAFNIRKTGERVEVVVTDGVVDVEDSASLPVADAAAHLPQAGAIRVAAGQLIVAETGDGALTVRPADRVAALAWRSGSLQFVDEKLGLVVANLNRYTRHDVVITDPSLADLRYTGTVLEGHEGEWLAAIEKVFPITVQHDAQGRATLMRRAKAASS